jgi:putative SOS response-associated peptidase YedK
MCGRYYIADEDHDDELRAIIEEVNRKVLNDSVDVKTGGEVYPANVVPVCVRDGSNGYKSIAAKWGFSIPNRPQPIINARLETVAEKPMFNRAEPCLVPATNYFEWETVAEHEPEQLSFDELMLTSKPAKTRKVKRAIAPDGKPGLFFMAGLIRAESHLPVPAFTIITRDAGLSIRHIHDRMPAVMNRRNAVKWLAGAPSVVKLSDELTVNMLMPF